MISVLFDREAVLETEAPDYFRDLNLDQVVAALTAGRDDYDLAPFFFTRLRDPDAVAYRHEVVRDLQDAEIRNAVDAFADGMREMRKYLAFLAERRYAEERQAWLLDAARTYGAAVASLADRLEAADPCSRGLRGVRDYLSAYVRSGAFRQLVDEAEEVHEQLGAVRYVINIAGNRVRVRRYAGEPDYTIEVERTFERFKLREVKDRRAKLSVRAELDHVEAQVLAGVVQLHPDAFGALTAFCQRHAEFVEPEIERFDREAQFYLAYLDHMARLESAGLAFCLPEVSARSKEIRAIDTFDLALAGSRAQETVTNDLWLDEPERIIVVSGPNQGGKTTFARTFGQLHHLAAIGCPVPGSAARLFLCDRLFTHFEREEDLETLSGKLEDDLVRVHGILGAATADSVVVMNESFGSTTLSDALLLGAAVLEQLAELDLLCVYVTFVDELASLTDTTVSMMSTVVPGDPASRTFKVVRKPADGLAYAAAIAEKYGLSYARLRERVAA